MRGCQSLGDELLGEILEDIEWEDSDISVKVKQARLEESRRRSSCALIPNIRQVLEKYEEIKQNVSKNASRYFFGDISNDRETRQPSLDKLVKCPPKDPLDEFCSLHASRNLPDDSLSIEEETYHSKLEPKKTSQSEVDFSPKVGSTMHLLNTEYDVERYKRSKQDLDSSVDMNKNNRSRRTSLCFLAKKKNPNKIPDDNNKKTVESAGNKPK